MTGHQLLAEWVDRFETQTEAARVLGVSRQWVSLWMKSPERGISRETAVRISAVTGIPLLALLFPTTTQYACAEDVGR